DAARRSGASRIERQSHTRGAVSRSRRPRNADGLTGARVHALLERKVPQAGGVGGAGLPDATKGRFVVGIRRLDAILRRDAFGALGILDAAKIARVPCGDRSIFE